MERQPTCQFVQVIIGYDTAKVGYGMGIQTPHAFLCICKLFSFSSKSIKIPLETSQKISYTI